MIRLDFANLLFGGPCNQACPDCIGRARGREIPNSLVAWPPPGLDAFVERLRAEGVRQLSLSGVNTDPLLYPPLPALLARLRRELPGVQLSIHTNGVLALARMEALRGADRVTLSLPSFQPETCLRMTGRREVLDLEAIARDLGRPLKVSILCGPHNAAEVPAMLARIRAAGVRRVVLRRRVGHPEDPEPLLGLAPVGAFGGNPVHDLGGLEVCVWDFERTRLGCLNLMPDGSLCRRYRLSRAVRGASMPAEPCGRETRRSASDASWTS